MPGATRYVPVPQELTDPTPEPRMPAPLCIDEAGVPVLCTSVLALLIVAYRAALGSCNADKGALRDIQPPPQAPSP